MESRDIDKLESELRSAYRSQHPPGLSANFSAGVMEELRDNTGELGSYFGSIVLRFASAGSILALLLVGYSTAQLSPTDLALETILTIQTHGTVEFEL